MKKIIIALLVLSVFAGCNNKNDKTEGFPPYKITEFSTDSTVEAITYEEYLKEKRKIDKYNKIILKEEYTKKQQEGTGIKAFTDLARKKKLHYEFNYLGIKISEEEQFNFIQGKNIHSAIKRNPIFKNPQTGKFDKARVQPFIDKISQNKNDEPYFVWKYQLNQITENLLKDKYESLLSSSFFPTDIYANWIKELNKKEAAIHLAALPYTNFNDSVVLTEEDYKTYYEKHKSNYKIYEQRYLKAAYIPTQIHKHFHEKEYKTFDRLLKSEESFEKIASMTPYLKRYSSYYYENTIPQELKSFFENGKPGDIYGPYFANNSYRAIKFVSIKTIPDKAWAHHILLKQSNEAEAKNIKQQIENQISKDKPFIDIAKQLSNKNPDKYEWGDTEWFRYAKMAQDFSDSTFGNTPGEIVLAKTQYGWHIINIKKHDKKRKRYFFTGLYRPLTASKEDMEATLQEATTFAHSIENPENFEDKAANNNYIIEEYEAHAFNVQVNELNNSKKVYNWAFNAQEGAISDGYKIGNKIYVFKIESIGGPGTLPLHAAKHTIEYYVRRGKTKEYIKNKYNLMKLNKKPIEESTEKLNMEEFNITGINFNQSTLANVGSEPKAIGLAVTLSQGEQTKLLFGSEHLFSLRKLSEQNKKSIRNPMIKKKQVWQTQLNNGKYNLVFDINDRMSVNFARKQDSYFLLPKYKDTLTDNPELSAQMFRAEQAFRNQNYVDALNGTKDYKGFKELTKSKPSKQRRIAALYAGLSALQLKKYDQTLRYLKSINLNDRFFSVIALGAQGDALSQQGKYAEALKKYKEAISIRANFMLAPRYILKMTAIYIKKKEYDQALKYLKIINEQYPQSIVSRNIEKYIGHVEYFAKKTSILANH